MGKVLAFFGPVTVLALMYVKGMGSSPVFQKIPRNVTEKLYQTVYFHCQATGFPKPAIKWVKYSSGNQETVIKTDGRFVIGVNGYLFILGVEWSDSGRYGCIAQNTNGRIIAYAHLSVVTAAVNIKMFTQPWPVRKGLNIISCLEFEKAKELKKDICLVAYNKYEPDGIHYSFIVGINLCGSSTAIQWNETMLKLEKYVLYEGSWFIGIRVLEEDNNSKYFCSVHGPEYRESIQIQLIYTEENMPVTDPSTTDPATEGKKTAGENMPVTHPSTTDPVTEGKKTAGDSCLVWMAITGTISTVAIILICSLLYFHGECLLNAAHVYCWERLLTAGQGLFGHQGNLSSGNIIHGEEIRGERASTERPTTADASHVNCSDGETTSLGTKESYPLPQTFEQPAFL